MINDSCDIISTNNFSTEDQQNTKYPFLLLLSRRPNSGQSNVNPLPIAHHYKCHENTNRSRVSQLSNVTIPISKLKYVPNPMQV